MDSVSSVASPDKKGLEDIKFCHEKLVEAYHLGDRLRVLALCHAYLEALPIQRMPENPNLTEHANFIALAEKMIGLGYSFESVLGIMNWRLVLLNFLDPFFYPHGKKGVQLPVPIVDDQVSEFIFSSTTAYHNLICEWLS